MTSNAIDYFATLGRKNGEFACKSFEKCDPSGIWMSAITDLDVFYEGIEILSKVCFS
jgi:hypothetical protein